jgi:hypothetical protein
MKMKTQKNSLRFFLQLVLTVSAIGFFSIAQAAIVVNMEVSDDEDALNITTHGTCNDANNSRGCITATGRQQINFNLVGDKMCSLATGEKWKLDSVVLSESKDAAAGISPVASEDFGADINTGRITDKLLHNDKHISIRNNNTAAYDIWYTVYATCGDQTIDADPRIKNDGTGNN